MDGAARNERAPSGGRLGLGGPGGMGIGTVRLLGLAAQCLLDDGEDSDQRAADGGGFQIYGEHDCIL